MNANQAIEMGIDTALMISTGYLEDLTEEEMLHRPAPECNHIKWQLGHLIASDNMIINGCRPGTLPDLPAGFADKYTNETCGSDSPEDFHSKEELLTLSKLQHDAIKAALKVVTEDELDQPGPESMKDYAPTWGAGFSLIGDHWLMHAGQWAVIRRQNGRKPMF